MIHFIRKLPPNYVISLVVRILGIGIRPMILFVATALDQAAFANAFALFISSIAGTFALLSSETHIALYKTAFNGNTNVLLTFQVFRRYLRNTVAHIIFFLPVACGLFYIWTQDIWLSILVAPVLISEKFFDEIQRFYIFKQNYLQWLLSFVCRYVPASIVVILFLGAGQQVTIWHYVIAYMVATFTYLIVFMRPLIRLYLRALRQTFADIKWIHAYLKDYIQFLYKNHLWAFLSANILLIDRFMVASTTFDLGVYVFFVNVFSVPILLHTLTYFTLKRPALIQNHTRIRTVLLHRNNLLPPLIMTGGCLAISLWLLMEFPQYHAVNWMMIGGLCIVSYIQCAGMVAIEFVFWRVGRGLLFLIDISLALIAIGIFFIDGQNSIMAPLILSCILMARVILYIIAYKARSNSLIKAESV